MLDVAHRHVVLTSPKKLRGLIERDRALHGLMARVGYAVLRRALAEAACEPEGVPGAVISLQTFGSYGANFHPHLHAIVTEGVFTKDGRYHPVIWPPGSTGSTEAVQSLTVPRDRPRAEASNQGAENRDRSTPGVEWGAAFFCVLRQRGPWANARTAGVGECPSSAVALAGGFWCCVRTG